MAVTSKLPGIKPVGKATSYLSMLLVSESGWGKTVFAGSEPDMLIISADPEGTESAKYQDSEAEMIEVRSFDELNEVVKWLRDGGAAFYKWICVDTVTEVQRLMQKDWLEKNKDRAKNRHPDVLGIDGYQITQNQVIQFIKVVNDLPVHVLYTAHAAQWENEDGDPYFLPMLHGQKGDLSRQVMGYMKIQGHGTFTKDGKRRIYFSPHGPYRGKDRTDSLGDFRDDLSLPRMAGIIEKKRPGAVNKRSAAKKTASSATPSTGTRRRRSKSA